LLAGKKSYGFIFEGKSWRRMRNRSALTRQDSDGKTRLSYKDPKYLQDRHHFPAELIQNLSVVDALAEQAAY